jgi:hypothetical protein
MNHLWRWKAFTIPGPLSSYGIGGPSWGSLFTIPGSYKPGMAFDSSLARLLGTLLGATSHTRLGARDHYTSHYN